MGGLPGVGKSALAKALAWRFGAVHLRIDTIEQALRNVGLEVSGPEGYLVARDLAADNLRSGKTVIVDAVNPLEITRDYWRETAARLTLETRGDRGGVQRHAPASAASRVAQQRRPRSWYSRPGSRSWSRSYEPWTTAQVVDTAGRPLRDTLSQVEAIVRRSQS